MTSHVEAPEQRRILVVLVIAQMLSGAGLAAGVTVGALLAQQMFGSAGWAGLPGAFITVGSATAAILIGNISQASGRRHGLVLGYAGGAIGAFGVVLAAVTGSAVLFFASFTVYGAGTAANLQARYAGADLAEPSRRGRAISTVLVATTFGAVAGPNLVSVMGAFAERIGLPELSGPFLLSGAAYGLGAVVLAVALRPDPLLRSRELSLGHAAHDAVAATSKAGLRTGAIVMASAQLIMVAIMTMTPIYLQDHHHGLGTTGFVIGLHIAAMYLPSPLSGYLVDRWGAQRLAYLAAAVLTAAGLVAALVPPSSVAGIALALVLLGLGWNLGLIAGTTMVAQSTPPDVRARIQGRLDMVIAISGAGAAFGSGPIVADVGYAVLSAAGAVVAVLSALAITSRGALQNSRT